MSRNAELFIVGLITTYSKLKKEKVNHSQTTQHIIICLISLNPYQGITQSFIKEIKGIFQSIK